MSSAERHVPDELRVFTITTAGVLVKSEDQLAPPRVLSHLERRAEIWERKKAAAAFTTRVRALLELGTHDTLKHCWPKIYRELDDTGHEIPATGALVLQCVVLDAAGKRRDHDIWVDAERRRAPLTEADFAFAGRIAVENDALGGGWTVNHISGDEGDHLTPRARMIAQERSTVAHFPITTLPEAMEIPALTEREAA